MHNYPSVRPVSSMMRKGWTHNAEGPPRYERRLSRLAYSIDANGTTSEEASLSAFNLVRDLRNSESEQQITGRSRSTRRQQQYDGNSYQKPKLQTQSETDVYNTPQAPSRLSTRRKLSKRRPRTKSVCIVDPAEIPNFPFVMQVEPDFTPEYPRPPTPKDHSNETITPPQKHHGVPDVYRYPDHEKRVDSSYTSLLAALELTPPCQCVGSFVCSIHMAPISEIRGPIRPAPRRSLGAFFQSFFLRVKGTLSFRAS